MGISSASTTEILFLDSPLLIISAQPLNIVEGSFVWLQGKSICTAMERGGRLIAVVTR